MWPLNLQNRGFGIIVVITKTTVCIYRMQRGHIMFNKTAYAQSASTSTRILILLHLPPGSTQFAWYSLQQLKAGHRYRRLRYRDPMFIISGYRASHGLASIEIQAGQDCKAAPTTIEKGQQGKDRQGWCQKTVQGLALECFQGSCPPLSRGWGHKGLHQDEEWQARSPEEG